MFARGHSRPPFVFQPDTELMDKIHAENIENMVVQNNANAMAGNAARSGAVPDRRVDEEGNVIDRTGTIVDVIEEKEPDPE